jgi:hypothetical protein
VQHGIRLRRAIARDHAEHRVDSGALRDLVKGVEELGIDRVPVAGAVIAQLHFDSCKGLG